MFSDNTFRKHLPLLYFKQLAPEDLAREVLVLVAVHLQNTEAFRGRIARHLKLAGVQLLKQRVHPLLQRIGAQVLLNHQVGVTTRRQAR